MSYLPPFATNLLAPLATLLVSKELIRAVHYCYIEIITVLAIKAARGTKKLTARGTIQ